MRSARSVPTGPPSSAAFVSPATWRIALRLHWPVYLYEGIELAIFMISACAFDVLLFGSHSPSLALLPSAAVRRLLMGLSMGITAMLLIHSPMGKRSGAHFNPAITLTYFFLRRIAGRDATFYILAQFLGGVAGVDLSALWLQSHLSQPSVDFVITVPGIGGVAGAFAAELFMATVLMAMVLWSSKRPRFASYTGYGVGVLIACYVFLFAPVSGFSINPARTTASACFAGVWTSLWIYFAAPLLGMSLAAILYVRRYGAAGVLCAKLHADPHVLCPFLCYSPGHRHLTDVPDVLSSNAA